MRFTPLGRLAEEPLSGVMVKVLAAAGVKPAGLSA
jgi:A/G-specific adenine glycosylase